MGYKEHERVSPGFKSSFEPVVWAVCFALRFVGKNNYYQQKRDNIEKKHAVKQITGYYLLRWLSLRDFLYFRIIVVLQKRQLHLQFAVIEWNKNIKPRRGLLFCYYQIATNILQRCCKSSHRWNIPIYRKWLNLCSMMWKIRFLATEWQNISFIGQ